MVYPWFQSGAKWISSIHRMSSFCLGSKNQPDLRYPLKITTKKKHGHHVGKKKRRAAHGFPHVLLFFQLHSGRRLRHLPGLQAAVQAPAAQRHGLLRALHASARIVVAGSPGFFFVFPPPVVSRLFSVLFLSFSNCFFLLVCSLLFVFSLFRNRGKNDENTP